jgi:hypothetical protein
MDDEKSLVEPDLDEAPLNGGGTRDNSEAAVLHGSEIPAPRRHLQDLFDLVGLGAHLWKDEDPDEHIRQLREGWD